MTSNTSNGESVATATDVLLRRFWAKVARTDTCWLWTGCVNSRGYGCVTNGLGKSVLAHRWIYEQAVGPIPDGYQVDHVLARGCVNKNCVRPDHLEAVTRRENWERSSSPSAVNGRKEACAVGHAFTPENTYQRARGSRECKTCRREKQRLARVACREAVKKYATAA